MCSPKSLELSGTVTWPSFKETGDWTEVMAILTPKMEGLKKKHDEYQPHPCNFKSEYKQKEDER